MASLHPQVALLSLVLVACGQRQIASDPEGEESSSSSSSSTESGSSTDDATTTSTTTSTTTLTTTTSDDTNDDLFFDAVDLSTVTPCDPFAQDCPEGEKCVPYGSTGGNYDANKCVPVMGDQAPGEPCTYDGTAAATDDCDENGACSDVHEIDGELVGTCLAFCMGTADDPECPPDSSCTVCADGCPDFCVFTCDPLAQDCGRGLACYWANNGFNCIFTTQNLPVGEPCGFINDCAPGLVCVTAEVLPACDGSACCSSFCNVDLDDSQCAALPGTACEPFFQEGMAPPGDAHIGVCIVPGA